MAAAATASTGTFLGPTMPNEVTRAVPLLKKVPAAIFQAVLQAVVLDVEVPAAVEAEAGHDSIALLYTALQVLVTEAVRNQAKPEDVVTLLGGLGLQQAFAATVGRVIKAKRVDLIADRLDKRISYPSVRRLRWRVDVVISTSSMTRVLKPSVLVELTLSDGKRKVFEVSQDKFHALRYAAAMLLKNLEDLGRNQVMKSNIMTLQRT
eukprot:c15850_g1_i1.p2 GENE.c15850_g1_i1~~c15850_g1_i1.p2  ORF type:complete len:221 (+),score=61.02 c15850_g1_i1:44-664(+)